MNRLMAKLYRQNMPEMNRSVMEGLACRYNGEIERYVDSVIRSVARSFPAGLEYSGYERCTPDEEYSEVTKVKNNKRTFDLARSDFYLVKYKFKFQGTALHDRYVYLPFIREGGLMYIGGSLYHITPVLSDKVLSPGNGSLFVRLLRDKISFKRCYHSFIVNGVRESKHVIWAQIYRKPPDNQSVPATTRALTSVVHYLFCKYGFTQTFSKYAGFVPVVGGEDITEAQYPSDKWVICQSEGMAPTTYLGTFYPPCTMRLAIPIERWTTLTTALVTGFFYIADHFPEMVLPDRLDVCQNWMVLLGHILFSGHYGTVKLYKRIDEHFLTLDDYVDTINIEKLKEKNYHIENFYDLLSLILDKFNTLVLDSENTSLSMYDKSLEVLYYLLYYITSGIVRVNFKLSKLVLKRPLTEKDVTETFNKFMKMGAVFRLTSGKIITESVSYSGDHMYPKITSKLSEQESMPGAKRGKSRRVVVGEDKHLDISMVEAGSVLFLSKANPTPTNHVNPYINLDLNTGTIIPNPKFKELREKTALMLKGRNKSTIVEVFENEDVEIERE